MTLDSNSSVWIFTTWGRPFRLVSRFLDCSSPETTPLQIECGYSTCTILTKSGDVYAWWPFEGTLGDLYREGMAKLDKDESTKAILPDDGTVIPCHTWEIKMDPVKKLQMYYVMSDLPGTGLTEEERRKETKLIKIAAVTWGLIGLTNKGHVIMLDKLYGEHCIGVSGLLENYSEIDEVKKHPAFRTTAGDDGEERPPEVELSSDTMLITDISANIPGSFFAYSSSMVLMGGPETTWGVLPTIIPGLQNRSVTSVVSGYDHFGALTSSGKLLTWGKYYDGNLGLGDPGKLPAGSPGGYATEEQRVRGELPPEVTVPTEVRFDHGLEAEGVKRYCVAVAAGGNSTAALVVDLTEDEVPLQGLE